MQDTELFEELAKWTGEINIFDILKVSRMEIKHSNVLGWLLDPNENHGLGESFLYRLLCGISRSLPVDSSLKLLSSDLYSFKVFREWKNIDILVVSDKNKTVIAIENKIGAQEHNRNGSNESQLSYYERTVRQKYSSYTHLFVYLTPEGELPSKDNWMILTYYDILEILEKLYDERKNTLKEEVLILIRSYIKNLKDNVIMDKALIDLCNSIYNAHKDALDLIYENRYDIASKISDLIRSIYSSSPKIELDTSKKTKSNIRFWTPKLKEYFNQLDYNNQFFYQFQIRPKDDYFILELVFHQTKSEVFDKESNEKIKKILNYDDGSRKNKLKDGWEWKRAWSKKVDDISLKSDSELESAIKDCIIGMEKMEKVLMEG
jgi:hypothetical protein